MSTDVDRVVNFSPSLHAAWSLPFQFIVTLVLLYQQVASFGAYIGHGGNGSVLLYAKRTEIYLPLYPKLDGEKN